MKIGIIGLCEAGNLGDDLILVSLLSSIADRAPGSTVKFLSHGLSIDAALAAIGLTSKLKVDRLTNSEALSFNHHTLFSDRDIVFFGGGGLIQDTHHPLRPYQWLRLLPSSNDVLVVAIGLGAGPVRPYWGPLLRRLGDPFDLLFTRDPDSMRTLEDWGWRPALSRDLVTPSFLRSLFDSHSVPANKARTLGIAVRAWPRLTADSVAKAASTIAARENISAVKLFVLESKAGSGSDVEFSQSIASLLNVPATVVVYRSHNLLDFIHAMAGCTAALSMKYHSSVIWATFGVPIYPITYAPKTSSLFDHVFNGLEFLSGSPRTSIALSEEGLEPHSCVAAALETASPNPKARQSRAALNRLWVRVAFSTVAFIPTAVLKLRSSIKTLERRL